MSMQKYSIFAVEIQTYGEGSEHPISFAMKKKIKSCHSSKFLLLVPALVSLISVWQVKFRKSVLSRTVGEALRRHRYEKESWYPTQNMLLHC